MVSMKPRLARLFARAKVSRILIMNTDREDSNFLYLTGFRGGMFEGSVLLARRSSMTLFVSPLEYGIAKRQKPREMRVVLLDKGGMLKDILKRELGGKRVGVNGSFLPYNSYRALARATKARLVDVSEQMRQARLVKDESELKSMKRAVAITRKALEAGRSALKVGATESQVAAAIDSRMLALGSGPAFTSIVAFDSNTALPHHSPGSSRLKPNSIVLFDIGARWNNYCADMTRTFMFRPDTKSAKYKKFADMHAVVLRAQSLALSKIREGAPANASHIAAEKYINGYGKGIYRGRFIHALGHSIGIDVHDGGSGLYPSCRDRLGKNMVFSDEPGIYLEGFGGVRIEDDVLVGKSRSSFM